MVNMAVVTSPLALIGNTPIIKLDNTIFPETEIADIYVKLENFNIGGSIKDRAALGMIEEAETSGILKAGATLVEATSGNTGIALALIAGLKGYKMIIVMPETMSIERRKMIQAYGAELILTDGAKGMQGAIDEAEALVKANKNYFMPLQFINPANPAKHYATTAQEIIQDVPDIDIFVAGVGTAGTISGIGKGLKEYNQSIKVVALEPASSAVLSGEPAGPHKIQGIGANFIPANYQPAVVDQVMQVTDEQAFTFARLVAQKNGLFVGISAGANIWGAYELAKKLGKGGKVVTVAADGGEKYLSTDLVK
jgi:cysteine synthase A